ncbi:MAG: hypothetical protein AVDCRST_MAG13-2152 [uncultured Solirubrobacteraceae bacterium]|uniref:ATP-grasp domain-containing protein n=1 Tax=uncultured Solirubrobacteraceae bacterium TaxID=1162706 RepID=A0A6J4SHJ8_9ACTN|nr:MAG: hypothetical protein AVDCRST_MAG13-2152 [uncultured Solirubrobacteraceae bacterium]
MSEGVRLAKRLRVEVQEARANTRTSSWWDQVDVWRHGFVARQARLFDFEQFGFSGYLSEYARKRRVHRLNRNAGVLGDKLVAGLVLEAIGTPTPAIFGVMEAGQVVPLDRASERTDLESLLRRHDRLVVKPRDGSHGHGVLMVERRDGATVVNGSTATPLRPERLDRMLVSEFVEQHEYARSIYPHATNTIRVMSLREHGSGRPFVVAAHHRFGTRSSGAVDNTGAGGLTADVDVATGALGRLAALPGGYLPVGARVRWSDDHPDTGARVTGTVVPRWPEIIAEIKRTMSRLPDFGWVGWDVAVTADGFKIIEGNPGPDIHGLQLHQPLLRDTRVRTLFEARGIVSAGRR